MQLIGVLNVKWIDINRSTICRTADRPYKSTNWQMSGLRIVRPWKSTNWEMSGPENQRTENCPTLQISRTEKCPDWEMSGYRTTHITKRALYIAQIPGSIFPGSTSTYIVSPFSNCSLTWGGRTRNPWVDSQMLYHLAKSRHHPDNLSPAFINGLHNVCCAVMYVFYVNRREWLGFKYLLNVSIKIKTMSGWENVQQITRKNEA